MKIWIFNNYNMLPSQGGLNRHYYLSRSLKKDGHEPVVFVGSHPHNTTLQLIDGNEPYKICSNDVFPWVLIKTCNYEGNKIKRVFSMFQYYFNTKKATKEFDKPDVIIGSSAHPLAALLAIKLGKKYNCLKIVEVRDLWPESIVDYGILNRNNPIVKILYCFEKWLYTNADKLIFTMEGAYDYIKDQGWDSVIPQSKVSIINNGIDIDLFDQQKKENVLIDEDLEDDSTYKIIYAGSLRRANDQIYMLFDAIELMQGDEYRNIRFLIYGKGELEEELNDRIKNKGLNNVKMKGFVEKKYMPYILSKCDLNILNCKANKILKYGGSQNKLFEYLASGHSIISGEDSQYSIVKKYECGISKSFTSANDLVESISYLYKNPVSYEKIRNVAEQYTYDNLVNELEKLF